MYTINADSLRVAEGRQRESIASGPLYELKQSILSLGILHPIVVSKESDGQYILVAGERRLRAMTELHAEGKTFRCGGKTVPPASLPVTLVTDLSPSELISAELEENIIRVDLTWQERNAALNAIHSARQFDNPKQTFTDTAAELVAAAGEGGDKLSSTRRAIANAAIITQHLHKPQVAKARSSAEALQIIEKEELGKWEAELVRRRIVKQKEDAGETCDIRQGNLMEVLPSMDAGQFDLILADPPYGMNIGTSMPQRTSLKHTYNDTPEYAKEIYKTILVEGWRLTKPKANILLFCDVRHFMHICEMASAMGWGVWRTPIIWEKLESGEHGPWGTSGPRRAYEMLFFAAKGRRGFRYQIPDIIKSKRVHVASRMHGAEKPVDLMEQLIDVTTLPGDYILDPTCGSGASIVAALRTKRRALGLELDPDMADRALARLGDEEAALSDEPELELAEAINGAA